MHVSEAFSNDTIKAMDLIACLEWQREDEVDGGIRDGLSSHGFSRRIQGVICQRRPSQPSQGALLNISNIALADS